VNDFDDQLTRREAALKAREEELAHRLRHAAAVELALAQEEQRLHTSAVLSERTEAELREVNERLVLATLGAQAMTALAEQATAQMSYMAEHDFLTELPNRSLLTDRLERAMALGRRHGTRVALMFLDLDHFKHVNDSLGHLVGDELLRLVARRLVGCVRASDTVSRQGGDEFVLLLSGHEDRQHVQSLATKVLAQVAQPCALGDAPGAPVVDISCSLGLAIFPEHGEDPATLLLRADQAMYAAKRAGRNRWVIYAAASAPMAALGGGQKAQGTQAAALGRV
jgi:diguanylate cyclase (GGDEF)-like protein